MRIFILSIFIVATLLATGACASRRNKARARTYEGDTSPSIRMGTEKPGYPLGGY